ncbi:MAG TPA: ABC transporter substrate-binding protein [Alphaproteobacteria bacterium]|nr:ABC transporter substrate-binding protein [Alphaproteobacteria bacterium]
MRVKSVLTGAAALAAALSATPAAGELKIGALYPITGAGASYGTSAMQGHELAVDQINEDGGVNGEKLVTLTRDTQLNPSLSAAAAKELITKDGVQVLVGTVSSAVALAVSEVAKREGVPFIATIAKTVRLTTDRRHDYVFRVATNTVFEGDAIAEIVSTLDKSTYCDLQLDYAYGHDLSDGIEQGLKKYAPAMERLASLRVKLGAADYSQVISQILGAGCEVVTSGLWGSFFINFAQQAKPFGLFDQVTLVNGGESGAVEVTGRMGDDYPPNVWANAYELWYFHPSRAHVAFQESLAEKVGTQETNNYPVLGFTAVQFLAEAAQKAGNNSSEAIASTLPGLTIYSPVGERTMDAETHQANTGQFWGELKPKEGFSHYVMDPVIYIPPMGAPPQ